MSDLKEYIAKRKKTDKEFTAGFAKVHATPVVPPAVGLPLIK